MMFLIVLLCEHFEELNHLEPGLRLSAVANKWKSICHTAEGEKYRAEAKGCLSLKQTCQQDPDAALKWKETLRRKLTDIVSVC
jgi:hypothetical protein